MRILSLFYTIMLLLSAGMVSAQERVHFVGGAPLDSYQPQVIVPLLEEAFRRNGISFSATGMPSSRALLMSNSGQADGELHRVYDFHDVSNGKYPNLIRVESRLMTVSLAVFSLNGQPIEDWTQLQGHDVTYQRGRQNVQNHLSSILEGSNLHPKNSDLIAFRMAADDRMDYVVSEEFEGIRLIATTPELANLKKVGTLEETHIYAYMHKRHASLTKRIGATLEAMKQDGTFQRIFDNARNNLLTNP